MQADLTHVKDVADANKRALRGSNGEAGLVAEVKTICKEQVKIWEKLEEHDNLLYKGKNENEPGLQDQVRDIRRDQKNVQRLIWLLVSAIVVGIVNIIFQFISFPLNPGG